MTNWRHMRESSEELPDIFEGLIWHQVLVLLSVLQESEYTKREHIEKRYNAQASHFKETLDFMVSLRAVKESEGHVVALALLPSDKDVEVRSWVSQRLFGFQNRYRTQANDYLRTFCIAGGEPTSRPSPLSRHYQSHVRNFLMEMGVVVHDAHSDCYLIAPEHLTLYILAQDMAKTQTPERLGAVNRAKESLGLSAEKEIVLYERERVGRTFAGCVEHVALLNAAAGYDVRSVTIDEGGAVLPRYIEVKAVPSSSLQFHWTRNEVLTAKVFTDWYYLYLLPVKANGRFAIDELEIVPHPHSTVLYTPDAWAVEPDVIRCCLRQERMHNPGVPVDVD